MQIKPLIEAQKAEAQKRIFKYMYTCILNVFFPENLKKNIVRIKSKVGPSGS